MPSGALLEALGTTITPDLLVEALTHRSFAHEHPGTANYERLEFLGDAVLELVVTETLFAAHPDMTEGQLAKMRAKAVSEESLSAIARNKLHAGPYILLGRGESDDGGADKSSILCDIVEALIGATFVGTWHRDGARGRAPSNRRHAARGGHRRPRAGLEDLAGGPRRMSWGWRNRGTAWRCPARSMRRCSRPGPYSVTRGTVIGTGTGSSKRKAQLAAAEAAWHALDAGGTPVCGRG